MNQMYDMCFCGNAEKCPLRDKCARANFDLIRDKYYSASEFYKKEEKECLYYIEYKNGSIIECVNSKEIDTGRSKIKGEN